MMWKRLDDAHPMVAGLFAGAFAVACLGLVAQTGIALPASWGIFAAMSGVALGRLIRLRSQNRDSRGR